MASGLSTKEMLNNMDEISKEVVKTKSIEGKGRVADWFDILDTLASFDSMTDQRHSKTKGKATLFGVLAVIAGIVTGVAAGNNALQGAVLIAVLVAVGVIVCLATFFIVKTVMLGRIDLANDFRETLVPFLRVIEEDIEPKGKLSLELDLSAPDSKAKLVEKRKLPPGRFIKLTETIYVDPWCKAVIPLTAGNQITLTIEKRPSCFQRTYRNARGNKIKTKVKWKLLTTVTMTLSPNPDDFQWDQEDVQTLAQSEKVKLANKKGHDVCKLVQRYKAKSATLPTDSVDPDELVGMCMRLCSMLNQSAERSA